MNDKAFSSITAVAAPLPLANVDTDKILPAKFLKTVERSGLGKALFHGMRFASDGSPRPDFILNSEPWSRAEILVALENFGSGSSREHAPWALRDFGIRAIIATSFADIFRQNCIKNGMLPALVSGEDISEILAIVSGAETANLSIDLAEHSITSVAAQRTWTFEIDRASQDLLAAGEEEIDASFRLIDVIDQHMNERRLRAPWILPITW